MKQQVLKALVILRRKQVRQKTGLPYSTMYQRISEGRFPKPISLGGARAVGWIESEIDQWLNDCIEASRTDV